MNEAERLQKIVLAQDKELRRLRRLLSVVRVAHAEFAVEDQTLMVTVTAVGIDEYHFIESVKPELEAIARRLCPEAKIADEVKDAITGIDVVGAVCPEP